MPHDRTEDAVNPYEPPAEPAAAAADAVSGDRDRLRRSAGRHRVLVLAILVYAVFGAAAYGLLEFGGASVVLRQSHPAGAGVRPDLPAVILALASGCVLLAALLTAFVATTLLAMELFSPRLGLALGVMSCSGCLGLPVMRAVALKATATLRRHGVRVGLLGASPDSV